MRWPGKARKMFKVFRMLRDPRRLWREHEAAPLADCALACSMVLSFGFILTAFPSRIAVAVGTLLCCIGGYGFYRSWVAVAYAEQRIRYFRQMEQFYERIVRLAPYGLLLIIGCAIPALCGAADSKLLMLPLGTICLAITVTGMTFFFFMTGTVQELCQSVCTGRRNN